MIDSNKLRADVLGMPFGTATSKLRKQIMFMLLQRLAENYCYRCGAVIENADNLSIEHKTPWMYPHSARLFWDLDNIAFSHPACNGRAARPELRAQKRKVDPEGIWCSGHQAFLPTINFKNMLNHWNGKQGLCRDCQNKRENLRKRNKRFLERQA